MRGYSYQVRRYRLYRFDGALPHHPPICMIATGDKGELVDHGTIDRATPETRDVTEQHMAQLEAKSTDPARLRVEWLRSPRGRHAKLFRRLQRDAGVAP